MPVRIRGKRYYRTAETCQIVGISRNTLFRWLREGLAGPEIRDRRGWRLFTEDQVATLKRAADWISAEGC